MVIRAANTVIQLLLIIVFTGSPALHAENIGVLEPVRLQLKWLHQFQFAGYYAAIDQGFYEQEGLSVKLIENAPGINVVEQVLNGKADFAIGDAGIIVHYANGAPIKVLAAIFQHNPLVFLSKQSSGIISPYEMAGKRVMFDTVNVNEAPLRAMLIEAGLNSGDYQLIAPSFGIEELINDETDVMFAYLTDQLFTLQQRGIAFNIINPSSYGIDFYGDLLFTSDEELKNHPGRAERFRRASLKGWQYALQHPEEVLLRIKELYQSRLSIEHLRYEAKQTAKLIMPASVVLGNIEASRMRRVADIYSQLNLMEQIDEQKLNDFILPQGRSILGLSHDEIRWLEDHPVLSVHLNKRFHLSSQANISNTYLRLVTDLLQLFEKKLGVRFQIVEQRSKAQSLPELLTEKTDLLIGFASTPSLKKDFTFSEPFLFDPVIIVNRSDSPHIGDINNLESKRIAIEKHSVYHDLLKEQFPKVNFVITKTLKDAIQMVSLGKVDAYAGDSAAVNYIVQKSGMLNIKFAGQTPFKNAHRIGITRNSPLLISIKHLHRYQRKNVKLSATNG